MNIVGYAKNQFTFEQLPFSAVDALVICWFSFFDFDPILDKLPLQIKDLGKISYYHKLDPYKASFLAYQSRKMMNGLVSSKRFQDARILAFKQVLDKSIDVQFGAIAIAIDGKIVVAFRGTDPSFTGWKEDFTMSYKDSIYSYKLADEFLKEIIEKYDEDIILTGYSKGGNIVTYLLSKIEDDSQIKFTYNFDGPGFRDVELFKDKEERLNRYVKIVPQSSFVGVLFDNETELEIIKSRSVMMLQHNCLEWVVKDNDFKYVKKRSLSSRYLDKSVNAWINSLDEKERERFTQIIFGELDKLEAQDFMTFFLTIFKHVKPLCTAYIKLSKKDRRLVNHVMIKLARNLVKPEKKKASTT